MNVIEIDGGIGEGGGQIIRTAIALSALTGKGTKIKNIRAKRCNPGLRPQHLTCIKAVGDLCNAELKYAEIGSHKLEFFPKKLSEKPMNIEIGTAGSVTLVIQSLLPVLTKVRKPVDIVIHGGTSVKWAPTIRYFEYVTIPLLNKFGFGFELEMIKEGFYPTGGGEVILHVTPSFPKTIKLIEFGKIEKISGCSYASDKLGVARVAERQMHAAQELIKKELGITPEIEIEYHPASSIGSGIDLWCKGGYSIIGANHLGEKKKRAEDVGRLAAADLIKELKTSMPIDRYMGDQLIPFMAISTLKNKKECEIAVSKITEHCKTNIKIVEKFLPIKFNIKENKIKSKIRN
ncbi:MAG: RNA 3'-phosphate cyclase [Candidatus Aenigmatarchaeota archaeon]|nr:MAG: RNA 3'-phosphate cyclase [Candidatus Aenigmarchaeota archaeon]